MRFSTRGLRRMLLYLYLSCFIICGSTWDTEHESIYSMRGNKKNGYLYTTYPVHILYKPGDQVTI